MSNIFSYIKNNVDIVDVISDYVVLSQSGHYYKGFSPFKYEKTASFTVTPNKKIFYCFSSNIGGDVVDFIARMENCSQYEAAQFIIQKYHLSVPKDILYANKNEGFFDENPYFIVYSTFAKWCHEMLYRNEVALDYLYQRGLSDLSMKEFEIGYCPGLGMVEEFLQVALNKGILIQDVKNTDIITVKNKKMYFSPYNRIIFPIKNNLNLCCGYGARIFLKNDLRPKYINTNNNSYFSKKNIVYGLYNARDAIKKEEEVYLVEGYMDALMMCQAGYKNTVATMGTACTEYHLQQLTKFTNVLNLVYDGDIAGKNAMKKIIEIGWALHFDVNVIQISDNQDPAELAKFGKLDSVLKKKENGINFYIQNKDIINKKFSLDELIHNLSEIIEIIQNIVDPLKKSAFTIKVANCLNISSKMLFNIVEVYQNKKKELVIKNERNSDIEQKNLVVSNHEKATWYLFFYFLLINKKSAVIESIQKIVFLYANYGVSELGLLIEEFYEGEEETLVFLKKKNENLYQYGLKIYTKYNFHSSQFSIFYKKIFLMSWQIFKIHNGDLSIKDFFSLVESHV